MRPYHWIAIFFVFAISACSPKPQQVAVPPEIAQTALYNEEKIAQNHIISDQVTLVCEMIHDESIPLEKIISELKNVESLTKDDPLRYLRAVQTIVQQFQDRKDDEKAVALAKDIAYKAAFLSLENDSFNLAEQTQVLNDQLTILVTGLPLRKTEVVVDCDPKLRKKIVGRYLELYQRLMSQVEEDYDPDSKENLPQFKSFRPPDSYIGPYISGLDYSMADDKATRDAYKKYM